MTESEPGFVRLHPLSPVLTVLAGASPFSLLAGVVLLSSGFGRLVIALGVVAVIVRFLAYWRTTYQLTEERLVVRSGWFERSERVVSPDRLQQVEVIQALRHRIFGVAEVKITMAGSTHISLDSVSVEEAAHLHDTLERGRRLRTDPDAAPVGEGAGPAASAPPPPRVPLLQLDLAILALGAVTGAGLTVFPVAVLALFNQLGSTLGQQVDVEIVLQLSAVFLIVSVTAGCLLVAIGVMWARYYGYTLSRSGHDVHVAYGLLDRRSSVIPLRRIQRVALKANALRRAARLTSIDASVAQAVQSEGSGSVDDTVPVVRDAQAADLLALLAGVPEVPAASQTHPPAARRRAMVRRAVLLSPVWVVGGLVQWWYAPILVAVTLAVAAVWADRWYRRLRHGADETVLVAEHGVILWQRAVQPWAKVQSLSTKQTPTQRRVGLLDLHLHIAGGTDTTTVRDITPSQAAAVLAHAPDLAAMFPSVTSTDVLPAGS